MHTASGVVDQLYALPKPALALLIVQLVEIPVVRAAHEYSAVICPHNGRHLYLVRGHTKVRRVHAEVFAAPFPWRE